MWTKYSSVRINFRKRLFTIGNDNMYSFFKDGEIADKSLFSAELGDIVKSSGADSDEEARCLKEHIRQRYRETSKIRHGRMGIHVVLFMLMALWTALTLWLSSHRGMVIAVFTVALDAACLLLAVFSAIETYRVKVTAKRFFTNFKVTSYEFVIDEVIRVSDRSENARWLIRFGGSNYFYVSPRPTMPFERGDVFNCDVAENGDKIILFWTNGDAEKMWNWGHRLQR